MTENHRRLDGKLSSLMEMEYLNEAHSQGLQSVRAHFNVMAWGEELEELKHLRNDVGSQLASMECVPRHNTVDCPTLFWAAIPGNEGDFRQRRVPIPSSNRQPASSRRKPTIWILPHLSASRWQTASVASHCT